MKKYKVNKRIGTKKFVFHLKFFCKLLEVLCFFRPFICPIKYNIICLIKDSYINLGLLIFIKKYVSS